MIAKRTQDEARQYVDNRSNQTTLKDLDDFSATTLDDELAKEETDVIATLAKDQY